MAVQAHNPANSLLPDFLNRARPFDQLNSAEDLPYTQWADMFKAPHSGLHQTQPVVYDGVAQLLTGVEEMKEQVIQGKLVTHQKRSREVACLEEPLIFTNRSLFMEPPVFAQTVPPVSTGLRLATIDANSRQSSPQPSTSGRQTVTDLSRQLQGHLDKHRSDFNRLIDAQAERMKQAIEENRQIHTRSLLSAIEENIAKRLKAKDDELERATRKTLELEERLKQITIETQVWRNMAKNNELMAINLRQSLEQVVAQVRDQQNSHQHLHHNHISREEGCGESEVDDAESCQHFADGSFLMDNKEIRDQRKCKFCRVNEACVLLLPCRHLCLCSDCDNHLDLCPLCGAAKRQSWQVYLS